MRSSFVYQSRMWLSIWGGHDRIIPFFLSIMASHGSYNAFNLRNRSRFFIQNS